MKKKRQLHDEQPLYESVDESKVMSMSKHSKSGYGEDQEYFLADNYE